MSELTAKAKQQNIKTNDTGFRIETFRNEEIFNAAGPCVYAQGEEKEKNNGFAEDYWRTGGLADWRKGKGKKVKCFTTNKIFSHLTG